MKSIETGKAGKMQGHKDEIPEAAIYVPQQAVQARTVRQKKNTDHAAAICSGISCVLFVIISICVVVVVVAVIGGIIAAIQANDDNGGDGINFPPFVPPSDEEVREGDNHVGVIFAIEPPEVARAAFVSAANRWSEIVADTPITGALVSEGDSPCDPVEGNLAFVDDFVIDHLMIISVIDSIDGPNNILAAAGPCALEPNGNAFPLIGVMIFDSDDIDGLLTDGTFEVVILHEMGHVLGIGTLWSQSTQGQIGRRVLRDSESLLRDPINDPFTQITNGNNRPTFVGQNAFAAYQRLGGNEDAVPVEDGVILGRPEFNDETGQGSADGHWNIEDFVNELMVFAINPDNVRFPLSEVTIASLQDLGYTVNIGLADVFFVPNSPFKKFNANFLKDEHTHLLVNDILNIEPTYLE